MHPYDDMKSFVGFDDRDAARLAVLWAPVQPRMGEVVERFYSELIAHGETAAILDTNGNVQRLKSVLATWLEELLTGPHDHAYYARRERIGRVHVDAKVPTRYVFTAMALVRDELCTIAHEELHPEVALEVTRSLGRATALDLAIMTGTFIERREERQLESVQDLIVVEIPVTVLVVDADLRVTLATRASNRLCGGRDVVGLRITSALPAALVEAAELERRIDTALTEHNVVTLVRVDVEIDEQLRHFQLNFVPLDHPRAALLVHVEELTETVRSEARLRRSEALAQLGSLSAAVAHELRNPLAGILAAIQIIGRSMDEDDRRRAVLTGVEKQIHRLNTLVSDLLAYARPGTARITDVDLAEIASAVAELLRPEHPRLRIRVEGAGRAAADPGLAHQILLNLAQNAIQAVETGGEVLITIEGTRVVVADSGPGIPMEISDEIFTPFFTTRTRGTGLGLAICRRSARSMSATLELLQQGPLPGACFELVFPPSSDQLE